MRDCRTLILTSGAQVPHNKKTMKKDAILANIYYYDGRVILKEDFLAHVDVESFEEWLHSGENRILNDYNLGSYRACAVTDENGEFV